MPLYSSRGVLRLHNVRVRSWRRDEAERAIAWLESAERKMRYYNLTVYIAPLACRQFRDLHCFCK